MTKRGWYYKLKGRSHGPVSPEALRELACSGQLQPTDMISRDGTTNWIRAGNVKQLFGEPGRPASASNSASPAPTVVDHGPAEVYFGPGVTDHVEKR